MGANPDYEIARLDGLRWGRSRCSYSELLEPLCAFPSVISVSSCKNGVGWMSELRSLRSPRPPVKLSGNFEPVAHGTHGAGKSEKWEIRKSGKQAESEIRIEGRDRSPQRSFFVYGMLICALDIVISFYLTPDSRLPTPDSRLLQPDSSTARPLDVPEPLRSRRSPVKLYWMEVLRFDHTSRQ